MARVSLVALTAGVNHNDSRYTSHRYSRYTTVYMAVYRPCIRPVYTAREHDCIRAVCTAVFGRVHGAYMAVYTRRVHVHTRRVHGRYTAMYRSCIRSCTARVRYTAVYGLFTRPIMRTRAVYTAMYGPCRPVFTAEYGPSTRPVYTARVHDCVRAVCMAVFGRVCGAYTAVYTAGGIHGRVHHRFRPYTAVYGPCVLPVYTAMYGPCTRTQSMYAARAQCITTIFFTKDTIYAETFSYKSITFKIS